METYPPVFLLQSTIRDKFFYRRGVCKTKWGEVELKREQSLLQEAVMPTSGRRPHSPWLSVRVKEQAHCLKSVPTSGIGE